MLTIYKCGYEGLPGLLIRVAWPVATLYILFFIRAMGAGDIKLFGVISGFLNTEMMISVLCVSFFIGAGFSCYRILKNKDIFYRLTRIAEYFRSCFVEGRILTYSTVDKENSKLRFGICILGGFVCSYIGEILGEGL